MRTFRETSSRVFLLARDERSGCPFLRKWGCGATLLVLMATNACLYRGVVCRSDATTTSGSSCQRTDTDGDGRPDFEDNDPMDSTLCANTDGDGCDDCSSGTFAPSNDGLDIDADGLCDLETPVAQADGVIPSSAHQRRGFYAQMRHWFFFDDPDAAEGSGATDLKYTSSTHGDEWAPVVFVDEAGTGDISFSVYTDGSYVYYAAAVQWQNGQPMYYRRGLLRTDGGIVWDPPNIVEPADVTRYWGRPTLTLDGNGQPHIGFYSIDNVSGASYGCFATQSDTADGTWATTNGFPRNLSIAEPSMQCKITPLRLTTGMIVETYCGEAGVCYSRTLLGAETSFATEVDPDTMTTAVYNNEVHVVVNRPADLELRHYERLADSRWVSYPIRANINTTPSLSVIDPEAGLLGVVWHDGGAISFRLAHRNPDASYTWDSTDSQCVSAVANVQGAVAYQDGWNKKLWVNYVEGSGPTYEIKLVACN